MEGSAGGWWVNFTWFRGGGHICLLSEFQIWKCGHLVFQGVSHAPVGI